MATKNSSITADSLKQVCFDYISRLCSSKNLAYRSEYSSFCLLFKIYERIESNTYYSCTCEPFLGEKYCHNPDHHRLPSCYNCKIDRDCTGLNGHCEYCTLYSCDACALRDNLSEICGKLTKKPTDFDNIYFTLNKFYILLHSYWSFGQPDKEKYNQFYNHVNFSLPALAICKCSWW